MFILETPKLGEPCFSCVQTHVLVSNSLLLEAVSNHLEGIGYNVLSFGDKITGEAKEVAGAFAAVAQITSGAKCWPILPVALISGTNVNDLRIILIGQPGVG